MALVDGDGLLDEWREDGANQQASFQTGDNLPGLRRRQQFLPHHDRVEKLSQHLDRDNTLPAPHGTGDQLLRHGLLHRVGRVVCVDEHVGIKKAAGAHRVHHARSSLCRRGAG